MTAVVIVGLVLGTVAAGGGAWVAQTVRRGRRHERRERAAARAYHRGLP